MHITTIGDVVLDVIVDVPSGLHHDDDSEARVELGVGGQAANVASWVVALGGTATVLGPRGDSAAARLLNERLLEHGVEFAGVPVQRAGAVVSIVTAGSRTMASDPGDQGWLARLDPSTVPQGTAWLHVSAYPLLRADDADAATAAVVGCRGGARLSVDLSSASLIESTGPERCRRQLAQLAPDVVFANSTEWAALGWPDERPPFELVLKLGADGIDVHSRGLSTRYGAPAAEVVDTTGAGDALAAGYLLGGARLGLETAARCVGSLGAQP